MELSRSPRKTDMAYLSNISSITVSYLPSKERLTVIHKNSGSTRCREKHPCHMAKNTQSAIAQRQLQVLQRMRKENFTLHEYQRATI